MRSRGYLAAVCIGVTLCAQGCGQLLGYDEDKPTVMQAGGGNGGAGGVAGAGGAGGTAGAGGSACVPVDDMNECTDDVCNGEGMPVHNPKAAGEACTMGGSQCDGNGQCVVPCLIANDCPGADDACQQRTCNGGICGVDYTAVNTPIPTQNAGDCIIKVCDGNGATIDNNDDADVPDDMSACTSDTCAMGTPSNTKLAQGTDCTPMGSMMPLVCNAMGQCVGCNIAADCGANNECKTYTCTNNVCGTDFTPADTQVAAQTNNDCLVHVCDGNGNFVDIADDNDVPLDDGNACTSQTCAGGMPTHPNEADGFTCNDGDTCTQTDSCQSGACTGANPIVCAASDQCHDAGTCDPMTGLCSDPASMNGTSCNDGNACTQTDACQVGACIGTNSVVCVPQDVCHVAGTCDSITGTCDNPNAPNGVLCQVGGASGTCSGGVCMKNTGEPCTMASECLSGFCIDGVCCNSACGGSGATDCQACSVMAGAMMNGTCAIVPFGTTCRASAGDCDLEETCSGMSASCPAETIMPSGTVCRSAGDLCDVAETCTGSSATCPLDSFSVLGTVCRMAAGVCDVAETCSGMTASCPTDAFVSVGTQCAAPSCMGSSQVNADTCNGMGVCVDNGITACTTGYTCVTNACKTYCMADSDCATGFFCSGSDACIPLSGNGVACTASGHCSSGFCVDGVCCNNACTATCQACNVAGSLGTCSDIPVGQDDTNATMTCSGATQSCDGAGACKKEVGQVCGTNSDCLSNLCNGGVCNGASCNGLPSTCGPSNNESCCVSSVVTGGTYNRSNDAMYPATVNDFRLDRFEITVGRFRKFVEAYPGNKPSSGAGAHPLIAGSGWNTAWDASLPTDQAALKAAVKCSSSYQTWTDTAGANEKLPMNCLNWYESFAFCAWDGGRMPTEAEWNYAAAGGDQQRQYPWSVPPTSTMIDGSYAVYNCLGDGSVAGSCAFADILTGGSKSPKGDGRWGQADLGGSMWEWNLDWYQSPYTNPCNNCANVTQNTNRVIRGGNWGSGASSLLSSGRNIGTPANHGDSIGARCSRTP